MKNIWYADNRDIIKWGGIVHLCNTTGIKHVTQIAYFRESSRLQLDFNGKDVSIPQDVIIHFRSMRDIKQLGTKVGITIDVVENEFSHNDREKYTKSICQQIQKQTQRKIVLLDPDTGLAPDSNKAKVEHVKPDEVSMIWHSLNNSDFLVLYQHRFRDTDWRDIRKKQIAKACNINMSLVKEWKAPKSAKDLAKDVVFFFCEK